MIYFPETTTKTIQIFINFKAMKTKEYKLLTYQLKDMDTQKREVAFYFNAFGQLDSDRDRIMPGSSKKSVSENWERIKHLYNHWDTVGKPLSVQEDGFGTFMVSKLGRDTDSNNVLLKYEDGLITEHSFGFETVKGQRNPEGGQDIYEYKLWEASSLDKWGAQSMTPVISLKSMDKSNVQEWITRLAKLQKAVRKGYTDEQAQEFETQIEKITEFLMSIKETTEPEQQATTQPEPLIKRLAIEIQKSN
jgi:HK97 family phage prohead protease